MYAGWDKIQGFQLYVSDPSGNYAAWKAHATGKGSKTAIDSLKDDYKEGCSIKEALILAIKLIGKDMDATSKPDAKRFEIGIITRENKMVTQREVSGDELTNLIKESKVFEEEKK